MNETIRRAIAHKAATKLRGKSATSVYSHDRGRYTNMTSNFDHEANAYFTDTGSGFFHYGESAHVQLRLQGKSFSGFDYASSSHFTGNLNGSTVSIFEYGEGRYYHYRV